MSTQPLRAAGLPGGRHAQSVWQAAAAAASTLASLAVILWCADLGFRYAREIHPWCGTGGERVLGELWTRVPWGLCIPWVGCGLARGLARRVACCAAAAAVGAWLTVLAGARLF